MSEARIPLAVDLRADGLAVAQHDGALVLQQHAGPGSRPFVHPINAPDGAGVLTEDAPAHHPWQHGLYIGLNDVNGVGFWSEGLDPRRVASDGSFSSRLDGPATADGEVARWTVVTDYLDRQRDVLFDDRQDWELSLSGEKLSLDLTWALHAHRDLTFGEYEYGGLFLRMPYRAEVGGAAFDSEGQSSSAQRARWVAVSLPLPDTGRQVTAALLDHPGNPDSPVVWRIDNELGIGPSPSAAGAWSIAENAVTTFRYRLVVFGEPIDAEVVGQAWQRFSEEAM